MKQLKATISLVLTLLLFAGTAKAQTATITGKITSEGKPLAFASIELTGTNFGAISDSLGFFTINNIPQGSYKLHASCIGYATEEKHISLKAGDTITFGLSLTANNETLNEVIVTGVSRATLIRENPVPITSISRKVIEETIESNIIDVLARNVPGLNAVKTSPNISKPFIRGLGYNRILTLYDGIRQEGQQWGDEHGIEVDPYHIDKAEVLKGPASLMYGSDALAGVLSLFPFIPDKDDRKMHGKWTSEYQTNNNLIGNGLRLDYSSEPFLFALRSAYRLAKNYRNSLDGRVYNTGFNEKNLSAIIGFKSDKGYSHFNITLYDNLQGIPDGSRDSLTRKFTKQVYEAGNDDIKNRPVVSNNELNTYKLAPLHQHIRHYRAYTHNFYRMGNGGMNFLLAVQQNIRQEYNHPAFPKQAGMYVRLNTLNYGLRYNVQEHANMETTIGINGMLQNNKNLTATDFPIPDYNLYDGGMYVYAKWKRKQWTVSGGVRYDIRQVEWKDFFVKTDAVTGFNEHIHLPDTTNAFLPFPAYRKIFRGLSASLGFTFRATKEISLKANIGRGYRAPNITEMASNGLDPGAHIIYLGNRTFSPEFSLQEDIGASAVFKNISAGISIFNNHIQNYIYLTMLANTNGNAIIDAQGNKTYQYQQASAQLYGMEGRLSVHPEKLSGFSWDNSWAVVYGYNRKKLYKGQGTNGEYLPLIPPLKWLSSMSQKMRTKSIVSSFTPKIELEYVAQQNRFLGLNNSESATPAYTLFNIGMAAEIRYSPTQKGQLLLQVNNLFDKAYQSNLSRLKYFEYYTQSPNAYSGIYNMGRNICLKVVLPF